MTPARRTTDRPADPLACLAQDIDDMQADQRRAMARQHRIAWLVFLAVLLLVVVALKGCG